MFSATGVVLTIATVALDLTGKEIRGLPWQVWALIGFIIFAASLITLTIRLSNMLSKITNPEAKLHRLQLELDIEAKELEKWERQFSQAIPISSSKPEETSKDCPNCESSR